MPGHYGMKKKKKKKKKKNKRYWLKEEEKLPEGIIICLMGDL